AFALADRAVASLAHVHIAISHGLARYLAETEGFEERSFEIVHYGIAPRDGAADYAGAEPRLLCVGRLIPIKGHIVLLRAIAAAIGGLGELVVHGETGLLVEPGVAEPLERAIVSLAGDLGRAAELGRAGRERALAEFLESRCVERTEQLYERSLGSNGR